MFDDDTVSDVRMRLIDVAGSTAQELGLGRIVGQVVMYLYLHESECSLDQLGDDLGLSKAAVSIAARQLESLGLVRRVWRKGDRKAYYRTADDIGTALRHGLLEFGRQKIRFVSSELDHAHGALGAELEQLGEKSEDSEFLYKRIQRAKALSDRATKFLESPILKFFTKS